MSINYAGTSLCAVAIEARYLSLNCASLLAERLNWHSFNDSEGMDEEEREAFLEAIQAGDCFDFLSLLEYPVALQNQTVEYYFALERCCRYHPDYVTAFMAMEGPWFIPDDVRVTSQTVALVQLGENRYGGTYSCCPTVASRKSRKRRCPLLPVCATVVLWRGGKPACRSLRIPGELPIYTS